ncbi:ethylene-insensitive protein 2 isoform X1 [Manihot esculenta]|uniref:Uncharacterized protein n=4 Tax=Manihot esculenta TaxID=3983 RepID=A0ACB7H3G5_MANES|nr:ethylene-insensitive protein 2 isoform X1 [Manihot esculenta]XP_021623192.2 ethylene-insensitive protein 2 isoform X1 [Manihot esculenta]XP_021623193.2 ethylene-insensitive protein 2 isoform X1 [Manihot esculenta]XP_021623194.2 ethylene-insensitive protein 2 isoform X1 [Manihot esculenta]KAG8647252.1 hypothetical protein MANES_09G063600v8 [Manihot esculenta]KAG8647253.1 hypothetical protein MANES_09G063600v8 [Manihot esculenta]KAG8647254.1 hypothetical protein MANES_09G063600v8 [Manihot es
METDLVNASNLPGIFRQLLPAVGPGLLIAIGYVDPGKWAATVEGGARFGYDLVVPMLIFSFAAILCQYLSARIGVVTGRELAQICSDEYDKFTCMFLGVQTALSLIALDLTTILGIAHSLNLLFGVDLSTGVFLTAVDAILFPLFATLLERCKASFLCTCMAGFVLLFYFLVVLTSQTEIPFSNSMNGMPSNLSEESAFALMSLLGANIMPHNFYLHSSFVLQHQGYQKNTSKDALCHHHFFAILCIFSGIYLVNYVLMNSAASVFNSTGLVLLTFPDAMSLMEQVFRSPVAPLAFLIVLYLTSQITALSWNLGGQVVLHDFLRLELPNWLRHATIRVIAIVPALYCVWTSGVEGIYQLLIFTQVMIALLLPSSVIPLFRVASSMPIMGVYKISQLLEFVAVITFMGLLGLKIIFVVEMIFGDSDWVGNLMWNMGSGASVAYTALLLTACSSFCLMLWLAATPLKSATRLDAQVMNWEVPNAPEPSTWREESYLSETIHEVEPIQNQEELPDPGNSMESYSDITVPKAEPDLPETIIESDQELHLKTIDESHSDVKFCSLPIVYQEESTSTIDSVSISTSLDEVVDGDLPESVMVKDESMEPIEKTVGIEGDLQAEKEDAEGDTWQHVESSKVVPVNTSSLTSDGPPSFRSLSGKSDESGNGAGSLSRLAGLGRAARRQLAAVLDEFWGQLYDFHGQATQEAKNKKLDVLLSDSKFTCSSLKMDANEKEFAGCYPSIGRRGIDSAVNTNFCNSPKQLRLQSSTDSSYGVQRGSSSLWSSHMQLLDAYVQGSNRNAVDSSERRYSSVRTLPSSDGWDSQPATVHGYQIASIINKIAKDRSSNCVNGQMESPAPISPSLGPRNYRDPLAVALGQKLQNGLSSPQASRYQNFAAPVNSPLQSERAYNDVCSSGSVDNTGMSANAKKYHSLPDISGFSGPYRDMYMSEKSTQWGNTLGFGVTVGRTSYEPSLYSNSGSGVRGSLAFDDVSKRYGDAFSYSMSSDHGSIWSKQPYEQFGIAGKSRAVWSGIGNRSNSITPETVSLVDLEAQLLQSFRCCIVKLLKLEGSDWLFSQNDGADEDLIDRVAARERCLYEVETREINGSVHMGEPQYSYSDRKSGSLLKNDEVGITNMLISSVPNCGEGCVYRADLIISFGVWCIHRILDLSLMESRPELWGKYTYVLNRLQGIVDLAFSKPRSPISPCFCLQLPSAYQRRSSPPVPNGMLPPTAKPGRGKCTTAAMLLDLIKDVETAISCRKGRSGTAAGDVAFPKGKENLASVLKRYKRRLSNKLSGNK